jgi:hypothetical protein
VPVSVGSERRLGVAAVKLAGRTEGAAPRFSRSEQKQVARSIATRTPTNGCSLQGLGNSRQRANGKGFGKEHRQPPALRAQTRGPTAAAGASLRPAGRPARAVTPRVERAAARALLLWGMGSSLQVVFASLQTGVWIPP